MPKRSRSRHPDLDLLQTLASEGKGPLAEQGSGNAIHEVPKAVEILARVANERRSRWGLEKGEGDAQPATKRAVLEFREAYGDRYGTTEPTRPSDVGQVLGLAKARLDALALLLRVDPEALRSALDGLIFRAELTDAALAEVRVLLGIPKRKKSKEPSSTEPESPSMERLRQTLREGPAIVQAYGRLKPKNP